MTWPDRSAFRERANYLLALGSELAAPVLGMAARWGRRSAPVPPSEWRRVLLLGASHIGDVLYNTGSLPALRAGLPGAELFFVAPNPAQQVLLGNPHLAGVLTWAEAMHRAGEFDAVICYNSSSSWKELIAAWRLGLPNRAGYIHKGFSALVTHPIRIRRPQPYPAYFRDLVGQLTGIAPDWSLRPQVFPTAAQEAEAAAFAAQFDGAKPLLACFVTSRQPSGVWPAERFGAAIRAIHAQAEVQSVLLGAADDAPVLAGLVQSAGLPSRVAAGGLSLPALVSFLRRCRAVLCTDSGPRHLANAAGVPVFFVPNLAVGKIETGRYLDSETDLAPDLELVPLGEQAAAFGRIDPGWVAGSVVERFR